MKLKIIYGLLLSASTFFAMNQLSFVSDKHRCFLEDFNRQLWENRVADSSITLCYVLTFICLAISIVGFRLNVFRQAVLVAVSRSLLVLLFLISLFASLWMYDMHTKKEIVGYSEWLHHNRQSSLGDNK